MAWSLLQTYKMTSRKYKVAAKEVESIKYAS